MAGTTAPRKRTTTRTRPRPVPAIIEGDAGEFVPLRLTSDDELPEPERTVVAYLDDYELTIPKQVPPNLALKVMRTQRVRGEEMAMMEMLEEVLGPEGFERLSNWRQLTTDNLIDLFKVIQSVAMGALEIPKSGSRNG